MHASRYTLSFDNANKCPVKSKSKLSVYSRLSFRLVFSYCIFLLVRNALWNQYENVNDIGMIENSQKNHCYHN